MVLRATFSDENICYGSIVVPTMLYIFLRNIWSVKLSDYEILLRFLPNTPPRKPYSSHPRIPKAQYFPMNTLIKRGGAWVLIMRKSDRAKDTTSMFEGVRKVLTLVRKRNLSMRQHNPIKHVAALSIT